MVITTYSVLNDIEENDLQFDSKQNEEVLESYVDSYISGSGNNFQFDDDYFQSPSTIENDFIAIRQRNTEIDSGTTTNSNLYQFIFNYSEQSREDLLDYNFNISSTEVPDILEQSFEIIKDDFTSSPISFDYDFKFCEGGND
jgi:hypothetical protein